MDVFEVMRTQLSIKRFKPDPVSDEDIRTILTAATWAPSGTNAQPWEFVVLKDPDLKKQIADLYREGLRFLLDHPRRQGYQEPDRRTFPKTMMRKSVYLRDHLEESPVLVVVAMNLDKHHLPRFGTLKAIRAEAVYTSILPCIQNLMLAARALGIGSCLTTAITILEEDAKIALGMPEETQIIALIPMGYPADDFKPVTRIPAEEFTHRDGWRKDRRIGRQDPDGGP